jgi:hypothetical protein
MPLAVSVRRISVVLASAVCAAVSAQQPPAPAASARQWPDAATMEKRRLEAENLPLFKSADPVAFTLTADFKAIQGDRDPGSTKTYPATMQFTANDGSTRSVELEVRTRGHARRSFNVCDFAPLWLDFKKDRMKGSVFEGQGKIKLGVHCREGVKEFEQYVLREYAAYRIYNLITPQSFRARLARATYVDAVKQKTISTRWAMFIEDDDDLASRMGGRITEEKDDLARLDTGTFVQAILFEYLIGNHDMSLITFHNFKVVQVRTGVVYPIPYDFDYSGLVNATYAQPPPGMGITTVRDRIYQGPCRTQEGLAPLFEKFRSIRSEIAPMYASLPDFFDSGQKKKAINYLDQFYKTIDRPDEVKQVFTNSRHCLRQGLM